MSEPLRLSRRLIELTGCSRREAELYIEGGWVTVDGQVVEEPQFKVGDQRVELSAGATASAPDPVTLIVHKPAGISLEAALQSITPATLCRDLTPDKRVLKGHFLRQKPISTLQDNASGMVVFSQDWKTLRKLTDDRSKIEQEYVVDVRGDLVAHGLNRLNHGVTWKGTELPAVKASWQSENRLRLAMKNPQPGVIAQLCSAVGLQIVACRRIRIGAVSMGKLPEGQWRYLTAREKF
ncbi:rRNA pseudouridine synthase [Pseudomonas sp. DTU_2021_1001937_2_SI_NGA_ILE_001]|uniref:rRNA pseudouridine synthase n=1 Tax=Pseudomonas sp. DTU_2021_1001937_2_SI_NGA_ILE_001 TaxID=3077589 RepID=UPI0028FC0E57|nr:rRNA pseudouridine synthase [Pseudomonas sp. DTU_2021_1001937_2_SI_NGA_ILE_001]WNW11305.1 rRNA pseudouridine synthase [Pseudomonas sp. DTU_2021_1001937_2_SI_NGA_ILE_001]